MENPTVEHRRREATAEEIRTLPHAVDDVPFIVWVTLLVAAAERFTFYAVSTPWQNYIQNGPGNNALPGTLGLGQVAATRISNVFYFFSSLTPVPFAIASDASLGPYKTLVVSFLLNLCGCLALFVTSLPSVTQPSAKIAGLALSLVLLGLGNGGVKAALSPFIGDQYTTMTRQLIVRKNGKRVIADRTLTLQYIYNMLYWFTNIASLSSLISATYLEKCVGFWAAYLLPLSSFLISVPLLILWRNSFVNLGPVDNVLPQAGRVIAYSAQHRFRLEAAKPAFQSEKYGRQVPWDDRFVSELRIGLKAFQVMSCFVPFYLCMSQLSNNLVSQAGQMQLGIGIPNDMIQAFNDIGCIILGPIIQKMVFPTLQKHGISFKPIARMTFSFVAMGAAMAYAAGTQKLIYSTGPCYDRPLSCPDSEDGGIPNNITVWVQVPVYFLLAFAEILGFTTLSEYSYSEAPKDMRCVVQALRHITVGIGAALAIALAQVSIDPKILYVYSGLAVVMILSAPIFWFAFGRYDREGGVDVDDNLQAQSSSIEQDSEATKLHTA